VLPACHHCTFPWSTESNRAGEFLAQHSTDALPLLPLIFSRNHLFFFLKQTNKQIKR